MIRGTTPWITTCRFLTLHSSSRRSSRPSWPSMSAMHGWLSLNSIRFQGSSSRRYSSCSSWNTCWRGQKAYPKYIKQQYDQSWVNKSANDNNNKLLHIYSAFLGTQSALHRRGESFQPPPLCSIHLDAILHQNTLHTPAYWWRGDRVMKPISVWG